MTSPAPSTLRHLLTSLIYTVLSVLALGIVYPLAIAGIGAVVFPAQAHGSLVAHDGRTVGSWLVGQTFTDPRYFHCRPSAAGKGNDPTATGGTNFGPTSKKLIDATRSAIVALRKENPDTQEPIPIDLVTASGSGIDPDISPASARYQIARIARARKMSADAVSAIVNAHIEPPVLGFLGEPRVNVLALNLALDDAQKAQR